MIKPRKWGGAPNSLDHFARSGDARNPPINRLDIDIEVERKINSGGAVRDEPFLLSRSIPACRRLAGPGRTTT